MRTPVMNEEQLRKMKNRLVAAINVMTEITDHIEFRPIEQQLILSRKLLLKTKIIHSTLQKLEKENS